MNPEEETSAEDVEAEETLRAPEGEAADESMRQLITLAILAAAVIAFLALCLPIYIR